MRKLLTAIRPGNRNRWGAMNKLFGLFLLVLACWPDIAEAATRTWIGTTGTWDATTGTNWSGGVAPVAGDAVVFDGTSGTGTADSSIAGIAFLSLTAGAYGGTLNFNTNNPNMAFTSTVNFSGTGARTINMGSGTWTLSGVVQTPASFDCGTTTNAVSLVFSTASIVYTGNAVQRAFNGGGQTYGSLTINNNSTKGYVSVSGTNTFASITVGSGNTILFPQGVTTTISGAFNVTGTASAPSGYQSNGPTTNAATISVGSASSSGWVSILRVTKSGAGSITATNSFDLGGNTSITITPPSGSGSCPGRIIGGENKFKSPIPSRGQLASVC